MPLAIVLKHRLRYAITGQEVLKIVKDKEGLIQIDNRVRRDPKYPLGFQDVISIEKTGEFFRVLYDTKGRFELVKIDNREARFKLCKVKRRALGKNKIPYIVTHDGRTIRFPHPDIKGGDTIKLNLETGEVDQWFKLENGQVAIMTGGNNTGRVGVISHIEKHQGSYDVAVIRDSKGNSFATRASSVFVIGNGKKPVITLPKRGGMKFSIIEERDQYNKRNHVEEEEDDE